MPRLMFTNPFKTHSVDDFPNVVVPLSDAVRRNSITSTSEKHDNDSRASSDQVQTVQAGPITTLEALRAEVDTDLAAGGHDTAYDRELLS